MKNESIVLLTKDAMCKEYLPEYGNLYWKGKTPNIDQLAEKGIVYKRFYTAAPSSAMSYISMFTGKFPHEHGLSNYSLLNNPFTGDTLFDKANSLGFDTHIIWDKVWMSTAYLHSLCYGRKTVIHPFENFRQGVGPHYVHEGFLKPDPEKSKFVMTEIDKIVNSIMSENKKVFLWLHVPHVINGSVCYGEDIDLFDQIVGILRKYFDDQGIFISSDHGNMNGTKGKLGYGFDVNESAIHIPLITPKCSNSVNDDTLLSNVDMFYILFNQKIPIRDYIFSDSAYYAQTNRVLGIINKKYKYIYYRKDGSEELFDIEYDPNEKFNLISDYIYDVDRKIKMPSREEYFYPYWANLEEVRDNMRDLKNSMWLEPDHSQKAIEFIKDITRPIRSKFKRKKI